MRAKLYAFAMAAALILLCACGGEENEPAPTMDPYEGMVQVESGFGTKMWVELYDDVPVSTFNSSDFGRSGGFVNYTGNSFEVMRGIDVSEHQYGIDWEAVASEGIDFAIIRAGYRGYSQGGLYEDEYFFQNITGARENGIDVGVYFFSQAVTTEEAVEEAEYLLKLLDESGCGISMPVAFDWENIDNDDARTDGLDGATLTDCAVAFCERVKQAGHDPMVYAYRNLAYFLYDLPRLNDYALWIGALGDSPDFYYAHDIWQYSAEGRIKGIDGPVDLNLFFMDKQDGVVQAGGSMDAQPGSEEAGAPAASAARSDVDAEPALSESMKVYVTANADEGSYAWPCVSSSRISSEFGYNTHQIFQTVKYHSGVDIAADEGATVAAAADGTVTAAKYDSSHGNYVVISHPDGSSTMYAHMSSMAVSEGDNVSQGDTIGYVGSTGNVTGPHLHFEVRVDGSCVDPLQFFDSVSFSYSSDI